MTNNHLTKNSNEGRPIASIALQTGGLIGVVILSGLLVASCGSDVTDIGTDVATLTRAEIKTRPERHFLFERLDHTGVNQRSTVHDSDLPGASIAAYRE